MNAHNQRFNRTLQENFTDYHEHLLFSDLPAFNQKMADWLIDYHTKIPHHSLQLRSPIQYLIQQQPECQIWWTYTVDAAADGAGVVGTAATPTVAYQFGGQSSLRGLLESHGKAMLEGEMEYERLLDGASFVLPLAAADSDSAGTAGAVAIRRCTAVWIPRLAMGWRPRC